VLTRLDCSARTRSSALIWTRSRVVGVGLRDEHALREHGARARRCCHRPRPWRTAPVELFAESLIPELSTARDSGSGSIDLHEAAARAKSRRGNAGCTTARTRASWAQMTGAVATRCRHTRANDSREVCSSEASTAPRRLSIDDQ
jgi:hypothetical protein